MDEDFFDGGGQMAGNAVIVASSCSVLESLLGSYNPKAWFDLARSRPVSLVEASLILEKEIFPRKEDRLSGFLVFDGRTVIDIQEDVYGGRTIMEGPLWAVHHNLGLAIEDPRHGHTHLSVVPTVNRRLILNAVSSHALTMDMRCSSTDRHLGYLSFRLSESPAPKMYYAPRRGF